MNTDEKNTNEKDTDKEYNTGLQTESESTVEITPSNDSKTHPKNET